jgi:hypothetical protein
VRQQEMGEQCPGDERRKSQKNLLSLHHMTQRSHRKKIVADSIKIPPLQQAHARPHLLGGAEN